MSLETSFFRMTAAQLAAGLRKKAFSAQELCRASIERIQQLDPQIIASDADDAPVLGQAAVAKGLEQGRHQLAPGKVAGAAKQYEVKGHG